MFESLALFLSLTYFCWRRSLRYLRFFQQEGYESKRFLRWIWDNRAWDRRGSLAIAIGVWMPWPKLVMAAALFLLAFFEKDPRKDGKLPLKVTERLARIRRMGSGLVLFFSSLTLFLPSYWAIGLIQALPLFIVAAAFFLTADEKQRQEQFMTEARQRWKEVQPFTIGITGSFGKTSMKHACGELLQNCLGTTFWPQAGINTVMGNCREIRTRLRKGTSYAVMEMGAYGRGSITRLCDFTPPQAAIITAVGTCHLERFGDRETIYQAKSELAQALPSDGVLVCNGDNPGARRMAGEYPSGTTLLYGLDPQQGKLDCWASAWSFSEKGSRFTLHWKGKSYQAQIPLIGKIHLSNSLGAFTLTCALGASPDYAIAAMRNLSPVKNRLQPESVDGTLFLHDAYNSNPEGFASALDVMTEIDAKRRILVTPGMIELGEEQAADNRRLAQRAAEVCDIVVPVGAVNRLALLKGLQEGGMKGEHIIPCESREEAFAQLHQLRRPGDLVLIENDLPDLYEHTERF